MNRAALRYAPFPVFALCAAALWLSIASTLFVWIGGLASYYPRPWLSWLWATYLLAPKGTKWTAVCLAISAAPVTLIYLAVGLVAWRPMTRRARLRWRARAGVAPIERGVSDNHGHADWMSMRDLRRLFPGPDPMHGGVVVGEAYRVDQDSGTGPRFDPHDRRTWGQGGRAPLLIDPCHEGSGHSLLFAGSNGYKSTTAVTTLLHWTGSAVVLDPACELGPMLHAAREAMGHRVLSLSPATATDVGINVLDWINPSDALAETNVRSVVGWICDGPGEDKAKEDPFFAPSGRNLVTCFLADMLWNAELPPKEKTLRRLRKALVQPESQIKARLKEIHRTSASRMARDIAGSLMEMEAAETFSGILSNATMITFWLSISAYADLVSGNSFRTSDIANGFLSVFVQIPLNAMINDPGVARTLIGALLNAAYVADGRAVGRMLFLLDEAARLGRMDILEQARDTGRKYGIVLHLLFQSVGQLEKAWDKTGKTDWYTSVSWRAYAAIRDRATAREVSDDIGTFGAVAYSEGDNTGRQGGMQGNRSRGQNTSRHEVKRRLIEPEELTQDTRDDEVFVIARGRPVRCGRAIYFRRPEAVALVKANRFAVQES